MPSFKFTDDFSGFWDSPHGSYMAFRSLQYTYVGKKILEAYQCGSGSETLLFSLQIFDLRINHYKFAICDCEMSPRSCGFGICALAQKFACLSCTIPPAIAGSGGAGRQ
jgi:hypothetical protein